MVTKEIRDKRIIHRKIHNAISIVRVAETHLERTGNCFKNTPQMKLNWNWAKPKPMLRANAVFWAPPSFLPSFDVVGEFDVKANNNSSISCVSVAPRRAPFPPRPPKRRFLWFVRQSVDQSETWLKSVYLKFLLHQPFQCCHSLHTLRSRASLTLLIFYLRYPSLKQRRDFLSLKFLPLSLFFCSIYLEIVLSTTSYFMSGLDCLPADSSLKQLPFPHLKQLTPF